MTLENADNDPQQSADIWELLYYVIEMLLEMEADNARREEEK